MHKLQEVLQNNCWLHAIRLVYYLKLMLFLTVCAQTCSRLAIVTHGFSKALLSIFCFFWWYHVTLYIYMQNYHHNRTVLFISTLVQYSGKLWRYYKQIVRQTHKWYTYNSVEHIPHKQHLVFETNSDMQWQFRHYVCWRQLPIWLC